jgi:hypothetical protein
VPFCRCIGALVLLIASRWPILVAYPYLLRVPFDALSIGSRYPKDVSIDAYVPCSINRGLPMTFLAT